jgi:hypothetical protein
MINYYQPHLLPFLQFRSNSLPPGLKCYYYHSFEDGLWDFLQHKFPPSSKVTLLVPGFYCSDVLDNLKLHGYKYLYYPVDKNFQISPSLFRVYLWLYRPEVVVIFNACGITSNLFSDTSWLSDLPVTSWILEDNVHNLTNPGHLKLLTNRHLIMDSIRKVSPIPGSRMFGGPQALNFAQHRSSYFSPYFLSSFIYYLIFRLILNLGFTVHFSRLIIWAHDYWLAKHDDIIGDSFLPQSGFSLFTLLINRINYQKISQLKISQVKIYEKLFQPIYQSRYFYHVEIPKTDYGNLHVYPLGFNGPPDMQLEKYLEDHGLPVWFKFTDAPWCANRGVIFLPLGFHIKKSDVQYLVQVLEDWLVTKT